MGIDKKCDESDFYMAPYSIVDVVTIFSIFIVGSIGSLVIYVLLVSDQNIQFLLYSYTTSILSICAPYFWLKKKYKITFVGLGLKKGKYHLPNQLLIATIIAFVLFIVAKIAIPTIDKAELIKTELRAESFFAIILVPFTLRGNYGDALNLLTCWQTIDRLRFKKIEFFMNRRFFCCMNSGTPLKI